MRFIRRINTSTPSTTVNASRKEVIQCEETDSDDDGSEDEMQQGSAEEEDSSYISPIVN